MRPAFGARPTRRRFLAGTGAAAAGLSILPQAALAREEPELSFYNWDTYIGATTLADFKARTGIAVRMDLYANNDELFARLKGGNPRAIAFGFVMQRRGSSSGGSRRSTRRA